MTPFSYRPSHRYAVCLFLPDPARGPVPACHIIVTDKTARGLAGDLETIQQLLGIAELAWSIPGLDYFTRYPLRSHDACLAILRIEEARARQRAHDHALQLDYQDWIRRQPADRSVA